MLKSLLKKQFLEASKGIIQNRKTGERRSKKAIIGTIILFVALGLGFIGGFYGLSYLMAETFIANGFNWMYFVVMSIMAVFLGAFGSAFNTYFTLFKAGDNDLLLSLPIDTKTIIASRTISIYALGGLFSSPVMIPTILCYWNYEGVSFLGVIMPILSIVSVSFITLAISILCAYIIALFSKFVKNKAVIGIVCTLLIGGFYYFANFKSRVLFTAMAENPELYADKVKGSAFFLYYFGRGAAGEVVPFLISFGVVIAILGVALAVVYLSFLKLATGTSSVKAKKSKTTSAKASSQKTALLNRELKRFFNSVPYLMNCGLGIIIMPVASIIALVKINDIRIALEGVTSQALWASSVISVGVPVMICMLCTMNAITAPSISLEGKSLWLIKSMPVEIKQVLEAKTNAHVLLNIIPAIISTIMLSIAFGLDAIEILMSCVVAWMFIWFSARVGLIANLKHNNLEWTNEVVPIKQSVSVLISIGVGFVVSVGILLLSVPAIMIMKPVVYEAIVVVVLCVLNLFEMKWIYSKGVLLFEGL